MKRVLCIIACIVFAPLNICCEHKKDTAEIWLIKPESVSAEIEVKQSLRAFDSRLYVSFVPQNEITDRLIAAMQKGTAPDAFMLYSSYIPRLAEENLLAAFNASEQNDNSRINPCAVSACAYSGKAYAEPLFTDVYMLATNRKYVAYPPQTLTELINAAEALSQNGIIPFDKLTPFKCGLLFESALYSYGGEILLTDDVFISKEEGKSAIVSVSELTGGSNYEALGEGKAAFGIMTVHEYYAFCDKYPNVELILSPLPCLNRLQTVAVAVNEQSGNKDKAFKTAEFIKQNADKFAALYKRYTAGKSVTAIGDKDSDCTITLLCAKPQPSLYGYNELVSAFIPAAVKQTGNGLNAEVALIEAQKKARELAFSANAL